jgi:putative nucleotidyltransferase with HDIG domain
MEERADNLHSQPGGGPPPEGDNAAISELIAKVEKSDISSIKNVTSGIIRIINDPDSNVRDLKAIIEVDPPLTAKVLKTANSAYYFSKRHIADIEEAIIWIGFDNLKEIALSQKVCEIFNDDEVIGAYSRRRLWRHSVATANLSKMIYRMEFGNRGENIYAAGLLHDIGIITEDQFLRGKFHRALSASMNTKVPFEEAEREIMGFDHAAVGGAVAARWQFPSELVSGILFHHNVWEAPSEHALFTRTLFAANYFCSASGFGYRTVSAHMKNEAVKCMELLSLKQFSVDMLVKELKTKMEQMESLGLF